MSDTVSWKVLEESLNLYGFGKWARSAWIRPLKLPGWVKEIKTADREKNLNRVITDISDEYGERLDRKISALSSEGLINSEVLVDIYVNLHSREEVAKRMRVSTQTVRNEQKTAIDRLYSSLAKID